LEGRDRGAQSPAHWMIVSTLTARLSEHSDLRKGRNQGETEMSASGWATQVLEGLSREMIYEATVEEPSKLHLTTRMVTSSLK
jgi:hypothetical protein